MRYKNFSSFHAIKKAFGDVVDLNHGFTAKPEGGCADSDAFENDFFLLFRRSEYAAQVELACARIFKMMMGYGPEMEIVKERDKFYIASRRIKSFKEGYPDFSDPTKFQHISGLAATQMLYYFLCGTDNHSGNFGIQRLGQDEKTYRLDMPDCFDLNFLAQTLELRSLQRIPYIVEEHFDGDYPYSLPVAYVMTPGFQNEKRAMIKKIAETSFSQFEEILRATITTDAYSHVQAMTTLMIASHLLNEKQIEEMKARVETIKSEEFSLDHMINLFKLRHSQWRQIVEINPVIEQDLTLADPKKFMAEERLYHNNSSSDEEEKEHFAASEHDEPNEASNVIDFNRNRLFQPCNSSPNQDTRPIQSYAMQ
ncbi:hypothetical protein Lnau_2373 [Legionella nautarum]|uniref:Uncharacterized protein n=1 Tax=Legionella nautarum TaxID=45070 RepID=A0A0W0WK64_9GAMM|nr:hypothetical protein [Legionella nautarum]KTD32725.1 hypothetical protein Lnau_2373 [Legionella nautarum]